MTIEPRFLIGQATDPGLKRGKKPNQDAIGTACEAPDSGKAPLLILADGMGGYFGGEIASRLAVDTVRETYEQNPADKPDYHRILRDCVHAAHRKIMEKAAGDEELAYMGSTLVLAVLTEEKLFIANVGDSRAYLIRPAEEIRQLSFDHSLVMDQYRAGLITREEADNHPRKNVLTMSLSTQRGEIDPYITAVPWEPGDRVLICSDGLWGPVPEEQICSTVLSLSPQEAADQLVTLANQNGGPDNISVMIAENGSGEPAPDVKKIEEKQETGTVPARKENRSGKIVLRVVLILAALVLIFLLLTRNQRENPAAMMWFMWNRMLKLWMI